MTTNAVTIVWSPRGKDTHRMQPDGDRTACGRVVAPHWVQVGSSEGATCRCCARTGPPRFCCHGHDTWKVGRLENNGGCCECHRIYNRRRQRRLNNWTHRRMNCEPIPNLRAVRFNLGLTQQEMANYCGCSTAMICKLEKGRLKASERMRHQILAGTRRAMREERERIEQREREKLMRLAS